MCGISVVDFGGGVESVTRVESVADVSVVGLVYGFRMWPRVSDWVSSCGFPIGVGHGFDCGGIYFEI